MLTAERLKRIRESKGLSVKDMALNLNMSDRTLGSYEREERQPSAELIESLITQMQCNPKWLFAGEGEMFLNEESAPIVLQDSSVNFIPDDVIRIPLLEDVELAAGNSIACYSEDITDYFLLDKRMLEEVYFNAKSTRGIKVRGRSMEPTTKDSDIAFIDHSQNILHDGEIYAIHWNGGNMIKRLERMPRGCIRIISDNKEDYPPKVIDLKEEYDFRIIGKAVYFINKAM